VRDGIAVRHATSCDPDIIKEDNVKVVRDRLCARKNFNGSQDQSHSMASIDNVRREGSMSLLKVLPGRAKQTMERSRRLEFSIVDESDITSISNSFINFH